MKRFDLTLSTLLLTVSATALAAQDAKPLLIDAGPCLAVQSAAEKLACFEKQVTAAQSPAVVNASPTKAEPVKQSPPPVVAVKPDAANSASKNSASPAVVEQARAVAGDSVAAPAGFGLTQKSDKSKEAPPVLTSAIASLKQIIPNQYQITLQNGQVWRQARSQRYALAVGQEVRITQSTWGTVYHLAVERLGGFVDVERVY